MPARDGIWSLILRWIPRTTRIFTRGFPIDSPYNTYAYPGLPYGPISNPGLYSIKAALRPADTEYTYFAAGKDGVSHFFTDYDEFNAFVTSDQYIGYSETNDG